MPEPVTGTAISSLRDAAIGFYGKIPARGDFVCVGLPRGFVDPWHNWVERMLAASRAELGREWRPAWLEAAVWRFAFPAGLCGPHSVVGLWLPSVDHVGRYFPLSIALTTHSCDLVELIRGSGRFLSIAEEAGRAALEDDLAPEAIAARLNGVSFDTSVEVGIELSLVAATDSVWWTDGAPRVPARALAYRGLPEAAAFSAMLDARNPPAA